jgi:hypothetical protein
MKYQRTPFLTPAERRAIEDQCERTPDGCLLYRPDSAHPHGVMIRRRMYQILRVWWAETYGFTNDALEALDRHEVIHIAECPHTGNYGGESKFLCIEPTHLVLGTVIERRRHTRERAS